MQEVHKDDALIALCELAARRSSHSQLRQHACALVHQLCREPVHGHRAGLMCYLLLNAGVKWTSKRTKDKLVAAILVHLNPQNPSPWATLLT